MVPPWTMAWLTSHAIERVGVQGRKLPHVHGRLFVDGKRPESVALPRRAQEELGRSVRRSVPREYLVAISTPTRR